MDNICQSDKLNSMMVKRYKDLFNVNDKLNILEVGVLKGGFVNWMSNYFKYATVYGLDINIKEVKKLNERVKIFQCDQNDTGGLNRIGKECGKFDLIMDDGCHFRKETENTFNALWSYVEKDGWYAIEDWGMGYSQNPLYKGMVDLVLSITNRRIELKIKEFCIFLERGYSLALFKRLI